MNKNLQVAKYVVLDWLAAVIAWSLFYIYRKFTEDPQLINSFEQVAKDDQFWKGIIIIPVFWLFLYVMIGSYRRVFRKSRLKELGQTLIITLIGVTFIFFMLILDDVIHTYRSYYQSYFVLFFLQFIITYSFRLALTTITVRKIHSGKIGYSTLIVGSNGNAVKVYNDIINEEISSGNKFIGFVNVHDYRKFKLGEIMPHLGYYKDLNRLINERKVEEVIIAIERSEIDTVERIITEL